MQIIIIRHGEVEWNLEGKRIGQLNSPLTKNGVIQSQSVASRLSSETFDILYSSDLGRTSQTAQYIADASRKNIIFRKELRERHLGVFQGLTQQEILRKYPEQAKRHQSIGFEDEITEGEGEIQLRERSSEVMLEIAKNHVGQRVVVVTHGGFLRSFFEYVFGLLSGNGWRFKRPHAAYNVFNHEESGWVLETWADVSHLPNRSL